MARSKAEPESQTQASDDVMSDPKREQTRPPGDTGDPQSQMDENTRREQAHVAANQERLEARQGGMSSEEANEKFGNPVKQESKKS